jgi:hypothetical protein
LFFQSFDRLRIILENWVSFFILENYSNCPELDSTVGEYSPLPPHTHTQPEVRFILQEKYRRNIKV